MSGAPRPPEYWEPRPGGLVACTLCPHGCVMAPGKFSICKVRKNAGGRLDIPFYGAISGAAMDPIEKKPLYHFLPGSRIYSIGFVGCNLRCPFCQNWEISQAAGAPVSRLSPEAVVEAAAKAGAPSIAYTYSEPCVHFEFVLDAMRIARARGLRNVLVTNGCLNPDPARELLSLADAANVDLKCWSRENYSRELGGHFEAVLDFIRLATELCHVEATTLAVPGLSDDRAGIEAIAAFLASLSPDLPLHLSAYRPAWKSRVPATDPGLLRRLAATARERLRYVYVGNLPGRDSDTVCGACGAIVVGRRGYSTSLAGLAPVADGAGDAGQARCAKCGNSIPIVI